MDEIFPKIKTKQKRQTNRSSVTKETEVSSTDSFEEKLVRVNISNASKVMANAETKKKKSSEIRYDLVKKFQKKLKKGFYEIKADAIAEKMVQKISDDKDLKFV